MSAGSSGEIYHDVKITSTGKKGDGVAILGGGLVVFVKGAKLGDRCSIRIHEIRGTHAIAEVLK